MKWAIKVMFETTNQFYIRLADSMVTGPGSGSVDPAKELTQLRLRLTHSEASEPG